MINSNKETVSLNISIIMNDMAPGKQVTAAPQLGVSGWRVPLPWFTILQSNINKEQGVHLEVTQNYSVLTVRGYIKG